MSRILTFPVHFWLFGRLISSKPLSVFGGSELRDSGVTSGKIFGGGFDVQAPQFGITAIHLCYLGKGWEVALQLSTSFLEMAKESGSYLWNGQSCFSSGYSRKHLVLLISRGQCWVTVILLCNASHYLELRVICAKHISLELQSCMLLLVILALFLESLILSILEHRDLLLVCLGIGNFLSVEKFRKDNHCPLAVDNASLASILQVDGVFLGINNLTLKRIYPYTNQHGFDFIKYFGPSVEVSTFLYQPFENLYLWKKMPIFAEPSVISFEKQCCSDIGNMGHLSVTECVTRGDQVTSLSKRH